MTLLEELKWRGFINQTTFKDPSVLNKQKFTFYFGVDPSADSMQVGNLAAAMMVRHFIDYGHKAILLVGGATGMIGDPDGKDEERQLKSLEEVAKNKAGISAQYRTIFNDKEFDLVDNYDWFKDLGYLNFLRDIGKHFSMTQLLDREFIKSRIGKGGKGISYAEFSYSLIQGYDFLHLFRKKGATLQLCGADQWGNSITGVDLIRKLEGAEAHVWSTPLVINKSTGKKFGKTEGGAVWLDPKKTSIFDFYQFWLNADDEGVFDYLKVFTLLPKDEILHVIEQFKADKPGRLAQKTLAYEVTKLVHGEAAAIEAKKATEDLFKGGENVPTVSVETGRINVAELLIKANLAKSRSEAQRLLAQGGVKLNQQKVDQDEITIAEGDLLQVGKRRFVRIK
ncbi:MAG TPA: tyrosine--tRNA ligase [Candidatus Saccharimonadales bacterium]|nr:tyrosine--tRNA ligase [Candidatus Saccharimonadales bacterium]